MKITRRLPLAAAAAILLCSPGVLAKDHPRQFGGPALSRVDFNRLATRANLPLFWLADKNGNKQIDPDELAGVGAGSVRRWFVARGNFTPAFAKAYKTLVEMRRREAVQRELDAGRPTLVRTDLTKASAQDKALVRQVVAAASKIEEIYLRQTGAARLKGRVRAAGPEARTLFWRNHGPWCQTPATSDDPFCNGLPGFPKRRSEAYPIDRPQDEAMCKMLQKHPAAKQLLDPFTVVQEKGGKLVAVPYNRVFGRKMRHVAVMLRAAARVLQRDKSEQAFVRYLRAAAKGFETNVWADADEAWAAMSSKNSKWYLRVGPDEVYFDPCQQKAGFHVSFALIDKKSITWQTKLTPLRSTMERALARHIGRPYKARRVRFHMPDFIRIVLNAGDARHPLGATIGQSLPNWGKVAQEGRGRTVVMTNLYTDPDSRRIDRLKARSLLSKATMAHYTGSPEPSLINIILHEASHNFGPHSDYRIKGKVPKEIFGGKLASTLEELKAQTGGLWYLRLLRDKRLIDDKTLKQAYLKAITWAFGHISQGMFTPGGNVRPYSQLAAVLVGTFLQDGAMSFKRGRFTIQFDKLPASIDRLMKRVGQIKATGDAAAGRKLIDHFVKGKGRHLVRQKMIARKLLRYPKATFLYSVAY